MIVTLTHLSPQHWAPCSSFMYIVPHCWIPCNLGKDNLIYLHWPPANLWPSLSMMYGGRGCHSLKVMSSLWQDWVIGAKILVEYMIVISCLMMMMLSFIKYYQRFTEMIRNKLIMLLCCKTKKSMIQSIDICRYNGYESLYHLTTFCWSLLQTQEKNGCQAQANIQLVIDLLYLQ